MWELASHFSSLAPFSGNMGSSLGSEVSHHTRDLQDSSNICPHRALECPRPLLCPRRDKADVEQGNLAVGAAEPIDQK